jgi:hypothetical protein
MAKLNGVRQRANMFSQEREKEEERETEEAEGEKQ